MWIVRSSAAPGALFKAGEIRRREGSDGKVFVKREECVVFPTVYVRVKENLFVFLAYVHPSEVLSVFLFHHTHLFQK